MCIGFITYNLIFHKSNAEFKEGKSTDKLMGPSFGVLNQKSKAALPAMEAREKEIITVVTPDGLHLPGYFYKCPDGSRDTVVLVHGYNSSPYIDYTTLTPFYLEHGYNVLCTNNRGGKLSDGKYMQFGTAERLDTALWVKELAKRYPDGDIFLHGCSMGGATVCLMSELDDLPNVRAILSDCSFSSIRDEFSAVCKHMAGFEPKLILNTAYWWYKKKNGHSVDEFTPLKAVAKAKYPVLFVHGRDDRFIPATQGENLFEACASDKEMLIVPGAGHAASFAIDEKGYGEKALAWFKKYATH